MNPNLNSLAGDSQLGFDLIQDLIKALEDGTGYSHNYSSLFAVVVLLTCGLFVMK
jgi:hypothetical protein